MTIYYVYAYLRKDGTPYYIGKGNGNRAWQKHKYIGVPTNQKQIIIVETNLTEVGALALERRLINWYGRKDVGTGILRNMTDGGDGIHGLKHTEEAKLKVAAARKGKPTVAGKILTEEHKQKIRDYNLGKVVSKETGAKISAAKKGKPGKPHSEETRAKMRASQLARWTRRNQLAYQ